jgi:hypothetical protein
LQTLPSSSTWFSIAFGASKFVVVSATTATIAATIDYAINATSFVLPKNSPALTAGFKPYDWSVCGPRPR